MYKNIRFRQICSLTYIGTYTCNKHVKFGQKIPTVWKNVRKPQAGLFLTHTV